MKKYLKSNDISYEGTLSKIEMKKGELLQPFFEAFSNALESIKILKRNHKYDESGCIDITLYAKSDLAGDAIFDELEIKDTGVGFDDIEYKRLNTLNDVGKGFKNKGSGRIQFLHSFDKTEVVSDYRDHDSSTGFKQRSFILSKNTRFLKENAIICELFAKEIEVNHSSSKVVFKTLLSSKNKDIYFFNTLDTEILKEALLFHYMDYFCENLDTLPKISIHYIVNQSSKDTRHITTDDIPKLDKNKSLDIYYSAFNGSEFIKQTNKESLTIKAFKIPSEKLKENIIALVSKGEIAKKIELRHLKPNSHIAGNRYLFLISGDYIDDADSDTRGDLTIRTKKVCKESNNADDLEEIFMEDIESEANKQILTLYPEIKKEEDNAILNINVLKEMFYFSESVSKELIKKININDSDYTILKKVYDSEAKVIAEKDAKTKEKISSINNSLNEISTISDEYQDQLKIQVDEFLETIPMQNKMALSHYVARRKLVLELFNKIINKELDTQNNGSKSFNEKLLHNLIFQQSSNDPSNSDLWLVNEDFVYFQGISEESLGKLLLNGESILKEHLTEEEETYKTKQEGDAARKRPDVLLFPNEGKVIIIEFKSLDTNISEHLTQINRYASLLNNLSKDSYNFTTYYGYLIGENIDIDDVRDNDGDFVSAHNFDYLYKPHKIIAGKFGRQDGSLYTEIIKYSTLLKRAQKRNEIFINKLTNGK
jgi:hypothetical protein